MENIIEQIGRLKGEILKRESRLERLIELKDEFGPLFSEQEAEITELEYEIEDLQAEIDDLY